MPNPATILLVEDNPDDESLTVRALRTGTTANIEVARDGRDALDYLFNYAKSMPRLVLLASTSRRSTGSRCYSASAKTTAHA